MRHMRLISPGMVAMESMHKHLTSCKIKFATAMHYTALIFVPYSVTAGCSLTGNIHAVLPVPCCLTMVTF